MKTIGKLLTAPHTGRLLMAARSDGIHSAFTTYRLYFTPPPPLLTRPVYKGPQGRAAGKSPVFTAKNGNIRPAPFAGKNAFFAELSIPPAGRDSALDINIFFTSAGRKTWRQYGHNKGTTVFCGGNGRKEGGTKTITNTDAGTECVP
jgi:hypothetical protein